ncbi:MAG: ribosome small subunit-dependent GTPase A, partial [Cytophagia bacterium]|nr:ribosome small subunit-dependent GTPase A [Cytophagia bacterium]
LAQKTGEVSTFANKGTHTTTFAEMFEINANTKIIDTPGIKELGLVDMEPYEISHYFPEMRQFVGECRFNNCLHVNEPGCHIIEALEAGEIYEERYMSYLSMLEDYDSHR